MACKSKVRTVRWQKIGDKKCNPFIGDRSPYREWTERFGLTNEDGLPREFALANPDVLESSDPLDTPDIDSRDLMRQAIARARFSKTERLVLQGVTRGLTEVEIADSVGISRRHVRVALGRARKKCEKVFVAISRHSSLIGERRGAEKKPKLK